MDYIMGFMLYGLNVDSLFMMSIVASHQPTTGLYALGELQADISMVFIARQFATVLDAYASRSPRLFRLGDIGLTLRGRGERGRRGPSIGTSCRWRSRTARCDQDQCFATERAAGCETCVGGKRCYIDTAGGKRPE